METIMALKKDSKLFKKGQKLLKAASEYWEEYQKTCDGRSVVWLESESGALVLFTRSEYKMDIMSVVDNIGGEPLSENLFFDETSENK